MKGDLLAVVCALALTCFLGLVAAGAMQPPERFGYGGPPDYQLVPSYPSNVTISHVPGNVTLAMQDGSRWRYLRGKWVRL